MACLNHVPEPAGRIRPWAGGLLLASALLLGCGGNGGGGAAATPAKPTLKTGVFKGTLTLQDNTSLEYLGVVLADSDSAGTFRLVSLDRNGNRLPYQASGAITLDASTITSNGSLTVFAPAGTTFNGSPTASCTLSGTLGKDNQGKDTISGTLSGTGFNGTFTLAAYNPAAAPLSTSAGVYYCPQPYLSNGTDAVLALAEDGTFAGVIYPAGTLDANPNPDPATAIGALAYGTAQFVAGSQNILRINASMATGGGAAPSDYSGLAVLAAIDNYNALLIMTDNGSTSLAGFAVKP